MQDTLRKRYLLVCAIIIVVFVVLATKLGKLTIGGDEAVAASTNTTGTSVLKGNRGSVLDKNGQPLAFNQESYDIVFIRDSDKRTAEYRAYFTEIMSKTIEIIEQNGEQTIDTFAIRRNENGEFAFKWNVTDPAAMAAREKSWRTNMSGIKDSDTAEDIYYLLRKRFYIPEDVSYENSLKLLSIWQEIQLSSYSAHIPITIATDVSQQTVAKIETRALELEGMSTQQNTARVYPKGEIVSHMIGYISKITEEDGYDTGLKPLGYDFNDLIGKGGVEASMEQYLTGDTYDHQGKSVVELTKNRRIIRTLDTIAPTDGNDVVLSIDIDLQQKAYEALAAGIEEINLAETAKIKENEEYYRKILAKRQGLDQTQENLASMDLNSIDKAETGSIVVLEAKTGKVLAMPTYPSYDNNLFIGGISTAEYDVLIKDTRLPLINRPISSKMMPGSAFKMVTGLAGLEEYLNDPSSGIGLHETIDDSSPYIVHTQGKIEGAPSCWIADTSKHANQDIIAALKNSCNYYFFTVADRLGIEKLTSWASKLGLDTLTGIELGGEVAGQIGGQDVQYDNTKPINQQRTDLAKLVDNKLRSMLTRYSNLLGRNVDDQAIKDCSARLIALVGADIETISGLQIREIMREEMGIPEGVTKSNYWTQEVSSLLVELQWNPNQTIRTGIGQAVTSVTPVALARYVAALINGGTVYNVSLIDKILDADGNVVKTVEPSVFGKLDVHQEFLDAIMEGMKEVVSLEDGGTAAKAFEGFEYKDQIGGKTGTAQVSASNNIDIENTSWMVVFAPREDPEIVVVSCIPNGLSGSSSASVIREIVKFYLDRENSNIAANVIGANELVK